MNINTKYYAAWAKGNGLYIQWAAREGIGYPEMIVLYSLYTEYYGAAEPPVRCGESHLSGLTEPYVDSYSA